MRIKTTLAALAVAGAAMTNGAVPSEAAHSLAMIEGPVSSVLSDRGEPHVIMPRTLSPADTQTAKKGTPKIRNDLTPAEKEKLRQKYRNSQKGRGKSRGKGKSCNHKYRYGKCR